MKKNVFILLIAMYGYALYAQSWKKNYDDVRGPIKSFYYVMKNNKWGACDKFGNVIYTPEYEDIFLVNASKKYFGLKKDGKWGVFEKDRGTCIIPEFENTYTKYIKNGYWGMGKKEKWGVCDTNGIVILEPIYENIILSNVKSGYIGIQSNKKWGLINPNGKIISEPIYEDIFFPNTQSEYIGIQSNKKWGVINLNGKIILEPNYDNLMISKKKEYVGICNNNKWGVISINGNEIVPSRYDNIYLGQVQDGYIGVKKNDKWGVIDTTKNIILSPLFDNMILNFAYGGYIGVKNNSKWGVCDINGKYVLPVEYDSIDMRNVISDSIEYGYITVKKKEGWGVFLTNGLQVIPCKHKSVVVFSSKEIFEALIDGSSWYKYNIKHRTVVMDDDDLYDKYFDEGDILFDKRKWKKSFEKFKLAASYMETYEVYYNMAACQYNRKKYDDAIIYFSRCLKYEHSQEQDKKVKEMIEKSKYAKNSQIREREEIAGAVIGTILRVATNPNNEVSSDNSEYQAWMQYRQSGLPGAASISFEDFKKANARAAANGYQVGNTNSQSKSTSNKSSSQTSSRTQCSYCNGTGRVPDNNVAPTFGLSDTKYCNECKKNVPIGHGHVKCPSCSGRGYN